jgi:hypothetical protein
MKTGKKISALLLIAFYLFFPGNGLALANELLHDRGLPVIACSCFTGTEKNANGHPLTGNAVEGEIFESGCACSSHLTAGVRTPEFSNYVASLLSSEYPQRYPEVYIPIFVPPQKLV